MGLLLAAVAGAGFLVLVRPWRPWRRLGRVTEPIARRLEGRRTVADRLEEVGPAVYPRLLPSFRASGVPYPPADLRLVGLKQERRLEVYARSLRGPWRAIRTYPILAASGKAGPKLRYGDYQVPEGLYRVESLNPNSRFHLALRVSYPNSFDRARAREEHRSNLGGDIMIHGSDCSIGCLAMGDVAAEDLFVLAADTGLEHIGVVLAPLDLRHHDPPADETLPPWSRGLYREIRAALRQLPAKTAKR